MRRSKISQTAVVIMAGALGLTIALGLSMLCTQGRFAHAGLLVAGGAVAIGAICSLEVATIALLAVCFTDGLAKGLAPGPVSLLAKDLLLLIGLLRWVWVGLNSERWESLRLPLVLPAFLFIIYCAVEMFNTETASMLVALAGFRSWVIWIPVFVLSYEYLTTRQRLERLLVAVMVIALATGVYGIVQYNIGFGHLHALSPGFSYHERFEWEKGVRATSTLVHPGTFGSAMSLTAILCVGGVAFVRGKQWLKVLFVGTAAVCIVAMATSGSRAPLLGLMVGGLALLVLVRRPQFMFAAIVIGIGAISILNSFAGGAFERRYNPQMVNYSIAIRRAIGPFRSGLKLAMQRPLGVGVATGVGVGRGREVVEQPLWIGRGAGGMVESEYGRALKELGFPGAILFVWLLYVAVKGTASSYFQARTFAGRSLAAACIGVAVSTVTRLAVGSALYLVPSGPLFWLVYAVALRVPQIEAEEVAMPAMAASAIGSDQAVTDRQGPGW